MIRRSLIVALLLLLPLASWAPPLPRRAGGGGGGGGAAPVVQTVGAQGTADNVTSISVPVASGVVAGDLLVVVLAADGLFTDVTCTGYTGPTNSYREVGSENNGSSIAVFNTTAVGGDGNASCSWTGNEVVQGYMLRITGWTGVVRDDTWNSATNADVTSHDPVDPDTTGHGANTLILSALGTDGNRGAFTPGAPAELDMHVDSSNFSGGDGCGIAVGTVTRNSEGVQTISSWTWTTAEKPASVQILVQGT